MANINSYLDLSFNAPAHEEANNLAFIGHLISKKSINNKAIIVVLHSTWNLGPNVLIKPIDRNLISCTFKRKADMDKIEETGPWSIKGALLNLKRWSPELSLDEVDSLNTNFGSKSITSPPIDETTII